MEETRIRTRSRSTTTLAGTCTTSPCTKPASGSSRLESRENAIRAPSPSSSIELHPSVESTTSASGSRTVSRVPVSRATSSETSGAHSNSSSSAATRHAIARPGTTRTSSASAVAEALTTPIRVGATSGTEPRSFRVVEGCRHDAGGRIAGPELGRERAGGTAEPAEGDRRIDGFGSGRGGHAADDAVIGEQGHAPLRVAVDVQTDELPLEGEGGHPFERAL